jgi:PAS domain S-box-containing protein
VGEGRRDQISGVGPHREFALTTAALAMTAVFLIDLLTPLQGAVAVLYIAVPLLLARAWGRVIVIGAAALCAALATVAFLLGHWRQAPDSALLRLFVSLVALATATLLALRDRFARITLDEQARILELTHDTVIIRDADDVIRYWNKGAEQLYGYSQAEAVGRNCRDLLHCEFPSEAVKAAIEASGQWRGEMSRVRRDGARIVLASRWLQRRDVEGQPVGMMETSADLTERKRADEDRDRSELRYGAIFRAAGFAIWEADWSEIHRYVTKAMAGVSGDPKVWLLDHPEVIREAAARARIREVNRAALDLFGAKEPDDLIGASIIGRYAAGGEEGFVDILAGLAQGAAVVEAETRLTSRDGKVLDVVLRATLVPDGEPWSRALVMAFDETERKEARAKLEQVSAELAHASRISTLGQLAASIAHEVNQPLTAIVTFAKSGKRWLGRETPNIGETADCLDHIVENGTRAAEVIARVRALARKATPAAEPLDLANLADEAMSLVRREAAAAQVNLRLEVGEAVPLALGDRVQVQQVLVNLMMNAIQAMAEVEGRSRDLCVKLELEDIGVVRVSVQDCGMGILDADPSRIFTPFYTTKGDGMGMGLSICRSIVEGQGGRISAMNNAEHGATIAFTLPLHAACRPQTSV